MSQAAAPAPSRRKPAPAASVKLGVPIDAELHRGLQLVTLAEGGSARDHVEAALRDYVARKAPAVRALLTKRR